MDFARREMNDFRLIQNADGNTFAPSDATAVFPNAVGAQIRPSSWRRTLATASSWASRNVP